MQNKGHKITINLMLEQIRIGMKFGPVNTGCDMNDDWFAFHKSTLQVDS